MQLPSPNVIILLLVIAVIAAGLAFFLLNKWGPKGAEGSLPPVYLIGVATVGVLVFGVGMIVAGRIGSGEIQANLEENTDTSVSTVPVTKDSWYSGITNAFRNNKKTIAYTTGAALIAAGGLAANHYGYLGGNQGISATDANDAGVVDGRMIETNTQTQTETKPDTLDRNGHPISTLADAPDQFTGYDGSAAYGKAWIKNAGNGMQGASGGASSVPTSEGADAESLVQTTAANAAAGRAGRPTRMDHTDLLRDGAIVTVDSAGKASAIHDLNNGQLMSKLEDMGLVGY